MPNTAIYSLPNTESLDLNYLELRVLLNNLNKHRELKQSKLFKLVGETIGLTTLQNMRKKISKKGIQYDEENKAYFVTPDNLILKQANHVPPLT